MELDKIKEYLLTSSKKNLLVIYLLFLGTIVSIYLPIIGIILAYVNQQPYDLTYYSHYQLLCRTFWIYLIANGLMYVSIILIFIIPLLTIWLIIRLVIGLKYLFDDLPHPNPTTYWFR